ncbi:MAG TPA: sigma-70 family RNA polymerase sigma factor [Acidimicrobiia bacterium]
MPSTVEARHRGRGDTTRAIPLGDVSDEGLLARFAASDPDAASAFVERFQRRVYGLAQTIIGDPRGAEDVAQEALLRAWRHGAVYDPQRGGVVTWLLTITRNLAIDAIRVRRPVAVDPDDLLGLSPTSAEPDPSAAALLDDDLAWLRDALTQLPDAQRRALALASGWGLSAREIAERENIPLGTAKTRIRTALVRLRAARPDDGSQYSEHVSRS